MRISECWAVREKDENRLHVAEMRMLRWIRGKTRKDRVRNQIIQEGRTQPLKKNDGHGCTGDEKKGVT